MKLDATRDVSAHDGDFSETDDDDVCFLLEFEVHGEIMEPSVRQGLYLVADMDTDKQSF